MFELSLEDYAKLGQATVSQSIAPSTLSQVFLQKFLQKITYKFQ